MMVCLVLQNAFADKTGTVLDRFFQIAQHENSATRLVHVSAIVELALTTKPRISGNSHPSSSAWIIP